MKPQELHAMPMKGTHDNESRLAIDEAAQKIARTLLDRDLWRTNWRVEVDGCVYKFKIDGYPKKGSAKYLERERENAELLADPDAALTDEELQSKYATSKVSPWRT